MIETLKEWLANLPPWLNLKLCGAVVLIGAGLWVFLRALGEVVKIVIALALVGGGGLLLAKVMHWI